MNREIKIFDNDEDWLDARLRDITSTECAALFGESKYLSPYKLWHSKKNGLMKRGRNSERMEWGIRLQDAIAKGIAEDHGFKIEPMPEYIRIPELRIASSFDYKIGGDTIFEIKNVGADSFKSWWVFDDENAAAPPHIELQVQHQLAVSGYRLAYIGALIGGNKPVLLRRERNEKLINEIFERTKRFWESVDSGVAPDPDLEIDSATVAEIYSKFVPALECPADEEVNKLVSEYKRLSGLEQDTQKRRSIVKAKILLRIGENEKVRGNGYTIMRGTVPPKTITYERKGYSSFRICGDGETE